MTTPPDRYRDQSRSNLAYGRDRLRAFDQIQGRYRIENLIFSSQARAMIRDLGDIHGKRILECGCGQGRFAAYLASRGATVVGIDIGRDLIALATRVADLNNVRCRFCVGTARSLPFADEAFDVVVGQGVLHHLSPQWLAEAAMEAHRVLKPGGRALFSEPVENSPVFHAVQNIVPVGRSDPHGYRPSILQRRAWAQYAATVDDRPLSDQELLDAGRAFQHVSLEYHGFLIRLARLWPHPRIGRLLEFADQWLSHPRSPVRRLSQCVLVRYQK